MFHLLPDNCNTNFGGLAFRKGNNVFFRLQIDLPNSIGVGCPAHVLNNCLHHGTNQTSIDVENIIYKTYQYFSIYTVRTEELKDCNFVDTQYQKTAFPMRDQMAITLSKFI